MSLHHSPSRLRSRRNDDDDENLLINLLILEMDKDELVPIILGRPDHSGTALPRHGKSRDRRTRREIKFKEQWVDTVNHDGKWIEEEEEEDFDNALTVSFYPRAEPVEPLEWKTLENRLKPSIVISSALSTDEKNRLLELLRNHKWAIAWSIADIKGIDSSFCTHKILMEDEFKPSVHPQRRVNPNIKEVVKKEVIKLLDAGLIYPISDTPMDTFISLSPRKFKRKPHSPALTGHLHTDECPSDYALPRQRFKDALRQYS
ncbi:hypothetical protein Tco_0007064 [Tanacetum coccineum]